MPPKNKQEEIADGVDESDGRWQYWYSTALMTAAQGVLNTGGSGATPSFSSDGVTFNSGTDGDNGHAIVGSLGHRSLTRDAGTFLCKVNGGANVSISSLGDDVCFGFAATGDNPGSGTSSACFLPNAGDNTSGNIRAGGTNGSITYPTLNQMHSYTVIIDYAGKYITAGDTGFYIDGDPRTGDTADATINANPGGVEGTKAGVFYAAEGSNQRCNASYLEVAWRPP